MIYTRYQTAAPLIIGPVIKATDGYTEFTGLTSVNLGFHYWVGTGPTTGDYATAGSSSITEIASGYYKTWISTAMTDALGPGKICFITSGSSGLPFSYTYTVLAQHTYDALIKGTGTDLLQVDVNQVVGATVNSTFPWHQTSAQGFIIDTGQLTGLSTLSTANLNNLSTFTTANLVGISTLSTANLNNLSTFTTANLVGISTLSTANLNNLSTFGVSNVYDVWTHSDLMKLIQAHLLNKTSYDGSYLKLYDHGGTSFVGFAISTNERSVTT